MSSQDNEEKPLTASQLTPLLQDFMSNFMPNFMSSFMPSFMDNYMPAFYERFIEPRFRQMLRVQLAEFYDGYIEPRVDEKISNATLLLQSEMNLRSDDLYKKFEDLQQEYIFSNHHLRRLDLRLEGVEKRLSLVENHLRRLKPPLNS